MGGITELVYFSIGSRGFDNEVDGSDSGRPSMRRSRMALGIALRRSSSGGAGGVEVWGAAAWLEGVTSVGATWGAIILSRKARIWMGSEPPEALGIRVGVGGGDGEPPARAGASGRGEGEGSNPGAMSTSIARMSGGMSEREASAGIWMDMTLVTGGPLRLFSGPARSSAAGNEGGEGAGMGGGLTQSFPLALFVPCGRHGEVLLYRGRRGGVGSWWKRRHEGARWCWGGIYGKVAGELWVCQNIPESYDTGVRCASARGRHVGDS